jgi:hypothetical protein
VLLTADGLGTNAIMREAGGAKTAVWRWQERFMTEGVLSTNPKFVEKLPKLRDVVGLYDPDP